MMTHVLIKTSGPNGRKHVRLPDNGFLLPQFLFTFEYSDTQVGGLVKVAVLQKVVQVSLANLQHRVTAKQPDITHDEVEPK